MAATTDYDSLAQKHGGSVDYDSLASKYGAQTGADDSPSLSGFAHNAFNSTGDLFGNIYSAVRHPIDTLSNVTSVASGVAKEIIPAARKFDSDSANQQDEAAAQNFKQTLSQRYGSLDKFSHTLYKDPAGVLADLSTLFDGGGSVLRGAAEVADGAKASQLADVARTSAKVADTASAVTNPVNAITKPASAIVNATGLPTKLPAAAAKLYQTALKPSKTNSLDDIDEMVQTGLKNGIPISKTGYQKLNGLLQDLNSQIAQKIADGKAAGATIDPQAVANRVDQVKPKFQNQVNPVADVTALDKAKQEFLDQHTTPGKPATTLYGPNGQPMPVGGTPTTVSPIPVDQAQAIKQGTYKQLAGKYDQLGAASVEGQKALARGIKEEIAQQFPEINELNDKESKLLGLSDALENAVKRIGNHDIVDLATKTATNPVVALMNLALTPAAKSRLALTLQYAYQHGPNLAGKVAAPGYKVLSNRIDQYANSLEGASAADRTQ